MKRRSFFAAITALLAMLWPGLKTRKKTSCLYGSSRVGKSFPSSPAEVFGAAYEAGVEFRVSFATRDGAIRISKSSPPKVLPSQWVAFTRHKVFGLRAGLSHSAVLEEVADWLVNSMTPEEKERYHRCLAKGGQYTIKCFPSKGGKVKSETFENERMGWWPHIVKNQS